MKLSDHIKVTGSLNIKIYDGNDLVEERNHKNLVVLSGKQLIASRLVANTRPAINIVSGAGNGSVYTIVFATQPTIPYEVGSRITIAGTSTNLDGSYIVQTATDSSVSFNTTFNLALGATGAIASLNNGTIKTMRVGSSGVAANISDVSLGTQVQSVNIGESFSLVEENDVSVTYRAFFAQTGVASTIQEAGLFNESNIMLCRTTFTPILRTGAQSLEIVWKITIA